MGANALKGKIVAKGLNVEAVSDMVGMDKSTFYRKLNNFESFTIGDAIRIKEALNLTNSEATEIFLT